ncbi:MAG: aminotransferase class V-fold PLP-dependent enzyme [Bacillota bacterium]
MNPGKVTLMDHASPTNGASTEAVAPTDGLVYLDNAATSWPKPRAVEEAMVRCLREAGGNPGRSGHRLSIEAARVVFDAREAVARLIGAPDSRQVVFTGNATEALNLAIAGVLEPGAHVITTSMEHNSVARPLRYLESQGVSLSVIQTGPAGRVDPDTVTRAMRPETRLVAMTHASNVIGTVQPVEEVARACRERGVLFLVDAAQTAGCYPIDVAAAGIDLLAFTGHKSLLGPSGTGGLYVREGVTPRPLVRGGTGSRSELDMQPDFLPDQLESGTPNFVGLAGLGAGVGVVLEGGVEAIRGREEGLARKLRDGLRAIDGVTVYGPDDDHHGRTVPAVGVVSFNLDGVEPSDVGYILDSEYGVLCRVGLHCAPWAHRTIGTYPRGTVRLSLGFHSTAADVAHVLGAVGEMAAEARRGAKR